MFGNTCHMHVFASRRRGLGLSVAALIACAAVLVPHGSAQASCSPAEVQHDRQKGPWLLRVPDSPTPSIGARMRFLRLNSFLVRYLHHYGNYRQALKDGYRAPFTLPRMRMPEEGSLVGFSLTGVPRASLDDPRPELLYYRRTQNGFKLLGGGYRLLVAHESDIDAAMPTALAKWHRIEYACSAPPERDFLASFALRGRTLDWSWPAVDKYDLNPSIPVWPWTQK